MIIPTGISYALDKQFLYGPKEILEMNENLLKIYEAYITCPNARELERLDEYIVMR